MSQSLTVPAASPSPATSGTLVWSDEFDGSSVDPGRWTFETGNGSNGWGNQELEYYRQENAEIRPLPDGSGSALVITAKRESFGGQAYTSARLKTQGLVSWTYGHIEARMKLPQGQGMWPAFWMLGNSISTVGWPQCGEIDIMEMIGGVGTREDTTYGTAHWYQNGHQYNGGSLTLSAKLSEDFHVYALDWTPTTLTWSVDGQVFQSQDISGPAFSAFHAPFFLVVNLAVGGQWPGSPGAATSFPQELWVDWIRVYRDL